jgi:hypothetical protein
VRVAFGDEDDVAPLVADVHVVARGREPQPLKCASHRLYLGVAGAPTRPTVGALPHSRLNEHETNRLWLKIFRFHEHRGGCAPTLTEALWTVGFRPV